MPLPPETQRQNDTVIVNNPRGYPAPQTPAEFIENLGQALRPNGKIILQGSLTANPEFRPIAEAVTVPGVIPRHATPADTPPLADDQLAGDQSLPAGYQVVNEESVVSTAGIPKQAQEPPLHIMGEGFRRTDDTRPVIPNTRVVIKKAAIDKSDSP